MRSFRTRLFVATLGVALLASIVTAWLVQRQTVDALEDAAEQDLAVDTAILDEITLYATFEQTWDGIATFVDALGASFDRRIALTTLSGTLLADSDPEATLPDRPVAVIEPSLSELAELLESDGLEFDAVDFLGSLDEGDLDDLGEELGLDGDELRQLLAGEITEDEPEPALLFLGYPADDLLTAGSFDPLEVTLIAGVVIAAALLTAAVVAGRISRPVQSLTTAVASLGAGDLEARVDVSDEGEVGELGRAFNQMADELERGERARRQLVNDVAHELRNPIGVLQGNLEAAQDGLFATDAELLELLHSETMHLSALVDDLGELAAADAGTLRMVPEVAELLTLAAQVVDAHRGLAADRGLTIDVSGEEVEVWFDPLRFRQVVANLVTNAIAYTEHGGVGVALARANTPDGSVARLTVADTGPGLSEEQRAHVFDRFWRADTSRHRHWGGAGLGLAICAELVAVGGGTIAVEPRPGGGTLFVVELPALSSSTA